MHGEWAGTAPIYPPKDLVFRALNSCPLDKVGCVALCGTFLCQGLKAVCCPWDVLVVIMEVLLRALLPAGHGDRAPTGQISSGAPHRGGPDQPFIRLIKKRFTCSILPC